MVCWRCGRSNSAGTRFCVNPDCGADLSLAAPDAPEGAPIDQRVGARIEIAQQALSVAPGQAVTTTVVIHNTGTQIERFGLAVAGGAAGWAVVEPAEVGVYPGTPTSAVVRFAPPAAPPARAGAVGFAVRADSHVHNGLRAEVAGTVTVERVQGVTAELSPRSARGGRVTQHSLVVANRGNAPEALRLGASDAEAELRFELAPESVVEPGRLEVPLRVHAQQPWLGRPRNVPFQVTAELADNRPALVVPGMRIVTPRLGTWRLAGALALIAAVVAATIVLVTRTSPSTEPPVAAGASALPTPDPTQALVQMTRAGGIAGQVVDVTVYADGRAEVNRRREGTVGEVRLTGAELATLQANLSQLVLGTTRQVTGGDLEEYTLFVGGRSVSNYSPGLPPTWEPVVGQLSEVISRAP